MAVSSVSERDFDKVFRERILSGKFCERSDYYPRYKDRYKFLLNKMLSLNLPDTARILEIGGGQVALLYNAVKKCDVHILDIDTSYAPTLETFGIGLTPCDLTHDAIPDIGTFDVVILSEVIEHIPRPPYRTFEKLAKIMNPAAHLLLTTPNLYRVRNVLRLATGARVFNIFTSDERGTFLGHIVEFPINDMRWHLKKAGYRVVEDQLLQFSGFMSGSTYLHRLARLAISPALLLVPRWRDNMYIHAVT